MVIEILTWEKCLLQILTELALENSEKCASAVSTCADIICTNRTMTIALDTIRLDDEFASSTENIEFYQHWLIYVS